MGKSLHAAVGVVLTAMSAGSCLSDIVVAVRDINGVEQQITGSPFSSGAAISEQAADAGGGIDIAPAAPQAELRDVHPSLGVFALRDPGLRPTDPHCESAGREAGFLAHRPQKWRD